jgi:hypothetical protein
MVRASDVAENEKMTHGKFGSYIGYSSEINTSIVDPDQLMDHGLVCPLGQKGRNRIISSVEKEQQRGNLSGTEVK